MKRICLGLSALMVWLGILVPHGTAIARSEDSHGKLNFLQPQIHHVEASLAYEEKIEHEQAQELIQGWQVHRGEQIFGLLTLHQYMLSTGDLYYIFRYLPQLDSAEAVQLRLPIFLSSFEYRTILYPQGLDYTRSVWSEPSSASIGDRLPTSALYVDDLAGSYFFSYVDIFERQSNGVRKELYEEALPIQVTEQGLQLNLPNKQNRIVEQWGIISLDPLVDWSNQSALEDLRIADLNRVRKWSQEGTYYLTPASYTPSSATSFYMNPAHHIGEKFLRTSGARFFEDFALVSLYVAARTQNEHGYWYMTTQSDWLYHDYGIPRTYYDTRFSTDAALFLIKGYQRYQEPLFLQAARRYADFLVSFAEGHHFKTENGGYLVWDYGHERLPHTPTHVSLNHLVTEMNFLYELYRETKEQRYLELAHNIKQAVQDTAPDWKKATDGDLWYAYLVDGSYGLQDYPLLTLKDLRYSQRLIEEIDGEEDPYFAYLIQVKEEYLIRNNLPFY